MSEKRCNTAVTAGGVVDVGDSANIDASHGQGVAATLYASGRTFLTEPAAKRLLQQAGIAVPRGVVVAGPAEVETALQGLQFPLAAKIVSAEALHKSDIGGVLLNLESVATVEGAISALQEAAARAAARIEGFLLEEMASPGTEMVIGGVNDPNFGPMVMVGMGGIHIEVFKDVCYRLCPIDAHEAAAMLNELRCAPILDGARGGAPVLRPALIDILLKLGGEGGLLMQRDDIAEVDLNPVIVNADRAVAADAAIVLQSGMSHPRADMGDLLSATCVLRRFRPLFEPASVAVVGSSASGRNAANTFIRRLQAYGFAGAIYPIHPTTAEIEDLPAYPSLAEMPQPVDYAYVSIAAERVPDLLRAAHGRLKFAQVISSGFGEIANGGKALERRLVDAGRAAGCRILGPNCIGTYSPRGRLTFAADPPREAGGIGVILQSGGLGTDIIKRGQVRGLRFSGVVTLGNSADVEPAELLEFYLEDTATEVIGLYLEDIKDGRRLFDLLRRGKTKKPIVLMKGGRTAQGLLAAASHTGALAGDDRGWRALAAQTPSAIVTDVDRFLDALVALQFLTLHPAKPIRRLALFGNGGGTSVLAADQFAGENIDISPFGTPLRQRLEELALGSGTSVVNPIDAPVRALQQEEGRIAARILDIVYQSGEIDAVVMHLNLVSFAGREGIDPVDNLIAAAATSWQRNGPDAHFALVLRSDGSKELDDRRRHYRALAAKSGIPVFDEMAPAAAALGAVRTIEQRLSAVRNDNRAKGA
jgi:acyl-CoA synthetase (NDP forming)